MKCDINPDYRFGGTTLNVPGQKIRVIFLRYIECSLLKEIYHLLYCFDQALIFFLAGYETTNTTCGYMLYLLATNPDVQDKLVNEIDDVAPEAEDVGYQSISKMPYLEQIFCETERMYPPALMYVFVFLVSIAICKFPKMHTLYTYIVRF